MKKDHNDFFIITPIEENSNNKLTFEIPENGKKDDSFLYFLSLLFASFNASFNASFEAFRFLRALTISTYSF